MAVLLPARSGIERSGASRSNAFATYAVGGVVRHTFNVVTTINGTNFSAYVSKRDQPMTIAQRVNSQPDTAKLSLRSVALPFIPSVGHPLSISFGDVANIEFAGQVLRVKRRYIRGITHPAIDIECVDYSRLLDRRVVTQHWTNVSATQIAYDIIQNWTVGFSIAGITAALPTISDFSATNETPSSLLRRLVNLIDGGLYLNGNVVHLFGVAGDATARAGTAPQTLTISPILSTFKGDKFDYELDGSQLRTRSIVEGKSTTPLVAIPAGAAVDTMPIADGSQIDSSGGQLRIGSEILPYSTVAEASSNPTGSTVSTASAAGDTLLHVVDQTQFPTGGWAKAGDQVFRYHFLGVSFLGDIPATGLGSLAAAIAVGTPVSAVSVLYVSSPNTLDINLSDQIIQRVVVDDAAAQAATAAIEGGDGIHEQPVSDGRLNQSGATTRANAELADFKNALQAADWDTTDLNARPPRSQAITIDDISTTLMITSADLTFPTPLDVPRRQCTAASVHIAALLDAVVTATN